MFVVKFYSAPEQRQTRREAVTQSFRSEAQLWRQIAELPVGSRGRTQFPPSVRGHRKSLRYTAQTQDRTCEIVADISCSAYWLRSRSPPAAAAAKAAAVQAIFPRSSRAHRSPRSWR